MVAKGLIYLVGLEQRAARMEALVISDKPLLQEEKEKKSYGTRQKNKASTYQVGPELWILGSKCPRKVPWQ